MAMFRKAWRVKPDQNKKVPKISQASPFFESFLQLAAEKKDSKNGAARKFFGPSYFVTALERISANANTTSFMIWFF